MFADVGVEANVTPPVDRDWLADDLGAAWAVWVAGLGAYAATTASTLATATSDAAAIRSRGVKRMGIPLSLHCSADQLDSQIRRIARRAPLPRVGGKGHRGRSFEEPDGSRQCLAEPVRPSHTSYRRPFSAATASFHPVSGLIFCIGSQPWPTALTSTSSNA